MTGDVAVEPLCHVADAAASPSRIDSGNVRTEPDTRSHLRVTAAHSGRRRCPHCRRSALVYTAASSWARGGAPAGWPGAPGGAGHDRYSPCGHAKDVDAAKLSSKVVVTNGARTVPTTFAPSPDRWSDADGARAHVKQEVESSDDVNQTLGSCYLQDSHLPTSRLHCRHFPS